MSDGTPTGTNQLPAGGNVKALAAVGPQLLFSASDPIHGQELWRSDGTAAGTFLFKDVNSNGVPSNPEDFARRRIDRPHAV